MSRTKRGSKSCGEDFWSRRTQNMGTGKFAKKFTTQRERTRNRKIKRQAIDCPEEVEGRFPGE